MTKMESFNKWRWACVLVVVLCVTATIARVEDDLLFPHPLSWKDIRPAGRADGFHVPVHASSDPVSVPYHDELKCHGDDPAPKYRCKTKRSGFVLKFMGVPMFTTSAMTQDCVSYSDYEYSQFEMA